MKIFQPQGGSGGGGGGGSTVSITINQLAHGFIVGDVVRSSGVDGAYTLSQADIKTNADVVGIVSNVINANSFTIVTEGFVTLTGGFIAGLGAITSDDLFLSTTTAGKMQVLDPTTGVTISKPIAQVTNATTEEIYWHNYRGKENSPGGGGSQVQADFTETNPLSAAFIDHLYVTQTGSANNVGTLTSTSPEVNWITVSSGAFDIIALSAFNNLEYDTIVLAPDQATTVTIQGSIGASHILLSGGVPTVTLDGALREWISVRWDIPTGQYIQVGGKGASVTTKHITRTLTSAEILQLFTTPIQLIPTPGAGKAIFPRFAKAKLNFGTIPYGNNPQDLRWKIGTHTWSSNQDTIFTGTSDATYIVTIGGTGQTKLEDNTAMFVSALNANPTGGDGTITLDIDYDIINL